MYLHVELTYFLGMQVQQTKDDIFLSQTKYLKNIVKKYEMEDSKQYVLQLSQDVVLVLTMNHLQ